MTPAQGRFRDLGPRLVTAAVLTGLGGGALIQGGFVLLGLLVVIASLGGWELARLLGWAKAHDIAFGAACGGAILITGIFPPGPLSLLLCLPPVWMILSTGCSARPFALAALGLLVAVAAVFHIRQVQGLMILVWMVGLVVAVDSVGYAIGRLVGGAKLAPRLSPGKTWAGTVAGWVAAGAIGLAWGRVDIALMLALAAQAGDLAASGVKRLAGVSDMSNLLPGHGGVLDRFDGMIGAALALLALTAAGAVG